MNREKIKGSLTEDEKIYYNEREFGIKQNPRRETKKELKRDLASQSRNQLFDQVSGYKSDSNTDDYNAVKSQDTNRRSSICNLWLGCSRLRRFEKEKGKTNRI